MKPVCVRIAANMYPDVSSLKPSHFNAFEGFRWFSRGVISPPPPQEMIMFQLFGSEYAFIVMRRGVS